MKDTGVIRRIDDLGRIVIPKEIRKTLKIREGDSLEIFVDEKGIILRKFSPLGELTSLAKMYSGATYKNADKMVIITDTEKIIAANKISKIEGKSISQKLISVIEEKHAKNIDKDNNFPLTDDYVYNGCLYIEPIVVYGDIMGSVIMLDENYINEEHKNIIKIGSTFFGEYISS